MSTTRPSKLSAATYRRIRDYAIEEPSFTTAFAAWELRLSPSCVGFAVTQLLTDGIIRQIEPRKGPYGAVYQYTPPAGGQARRPTNFPELDERVGELAPTRGVVVPHTRAIGPSGKPGVDRERGRRGVRVKRVRQGT